MHLGYGSCVCVYWRLCVCIDGMFSFDVAYGTADSAIAMGNEANAEKSIISEDRARGKERERERG